MRSIPSHGPDEEEAVEETPFFQRPGYELTFADAVALKAIYELGGADKHVPVDVKAVKIASLRKLRMAGAVDLLMGLGTEAQLTAAGVAAIPEALRVIAAGPAIGGAP